MLLFLLIFASLPAPLRGEECHAATINARPFGKSRIPFRSVTPLHEMEMGLVGGGRLHKRKRILKRELHRWLAELMDRAIYFVIISRGHSLIRNSRIRAARRIAAQLPAPPIIPHPASARSDPLLAAITPPPLRGSRDPLTRQGNCLRP